MLCPDPLWGAEEPIPQLLNLLSADGWQMDPSPSIAHSWRTLPCPRSRPLPSALETSDWLMEGYKGQTPPPHPTSFNLTPVWKAIPAPELSVRSAESDGFLLLPLSLDFLTSLQMYLPGVLLNQPLPTTLHLRICLQGSHSKKPNYLCAISKK